MNSGGPTCRMAVLKIASRCNINCTYCYMYNKGDSSFRQLPKFLDPNVYDHFLDRVKAHCLRHGIKMFSIVLHGGEPLLASKEYIRNLIDKTRNILLPHVTPRFSVQTNGMMIDDEWCALFGAYNVSVSVSIDGPREAHDQYRLDHQGRGTYDRTVAGLKTLLGSPHLKPRAIGVLAVINIHVDPKALYRHFATLGIRSFDVLLPDNNYDDPPVIPATPTSDEPYGDWLIGLFSEWFYDRSEKRPAIKTFSTIVTSILGAENSADDLGIMDKELLVIETDGGIEAVDSLKICGESFTKSDAHVDTHEIDDALNTPLANLFHQSGKKVCTTCKSCAAYNVCGGGYIPHRYAARNGFDNPSVYCLDLLKLITFIQNEIVNLLPPQKREALGLVPITYQAARAELKWPLQTHIPADEELTHFKVTTPEFS